MENDEYIEDNNKECNFKEIYSLDKPFRLYKEYDIVSDND